MGRIFFSAFLSVMAAAAAADELGMTYSVKVDNLSEGIVTFKLDGGNACIAQPRTSCTWDIAYGSHTLDALTGGKHYSRDFELSDESDIQVHCRFDGTKFSGDSC
jgi:hypothetical protein